MKKKDVYFFERQRQRWWMWLLLLGINTGISVIIRIGFEKPIDNPIKISNTNLIITLVFLLLLSSPFLLVGSLKTLIDEEGIYVRLTPFMFRYKFYGWDSISSVHVRRYSPLGEFGGWGLRGRRGIFSYTMSGKTGLEFALKNGQKILVGTRQPDYLKTVLIKLGKMEQENDG
jgi:hypothetical protein